MTRLRRIALAIVLAAGSRGPRGCRHSSRAAQTFDILIRNGRVLDGTGNPWYRADIGITGDRIRAMGVARHARRRRRSIDAGDRYVTPGFIDVHSHAGPGLATDELKHGQPLLAQGLRRCFINPDGGGPIDLAGAARDLREAAHRRQRRAVRAARLDPPAR